MAVVIDGTTGISTPAETVLGNLSYTGTLTGNGGIVNLGSGQVYKDASGNVGIGTSSPAATLDAVANSSSFAMSIRGRSADDIGTLGFYSNNGASNTAQIQSRSGEFRIAAIGASAQTFYTNGSERARIDSSGNLLVGTTSTFTPSAKLMSVATGTQGAGSFITDNASWQAIACWNKATSGTIYLAEFGTGTTYVARGSITSNGTTVAYNTSSDYRLKEAIAPMTGALAKVALLKPVTYKWKVDGSDGQGFIAHELAEVEAGCVTGEKDAMDADGNPQYQGIDTSFLVATLTAAIQELKALVDTQAARITALETTA